MGRAAKLQSLFESAMTDFTEQLHYKGFLRLILGEKWESEEDLETLEKETKSD